MIFAYNEDESVADRGMNDPDPEPEPDNKPPVLLTAAALAVSFAICNAGIFLTKYFGTKGGSLPAITAVVVILATAFPKQFSRLAPAGETMAMILMQVSSFLTRIMLSSIMLKCFLVWILLLAFVQKI